MILLWSLSFLRSISSSLKAVIITRGHIQRIMMMRELISFSYAIVTTQVSWSKSICFFAKWGRFFFPFVVELFQKVSLIFVLSPFVSNKCELYRQNHKELTPKFYYLIDPPWAFSTPIARGEPVFQQVLDLRSVVVNASFVLSCATVQKLVLIAVKLRQRLIRALTQDCVYLKLFSYTNAQSKTKRLSHVIYYTTPAFPISDWPKPNNGIFQLFLMQQPRSGLQKLERRSCLCTHIEVQ